MNVSDAEAKKLLAAVKKASEKSRRVQVEMLATAEERAELVRKAIEAGIPRDVIAEAAGVARTAIYRVANTPKR